MQKSTFLSAIAAAALLGALPLSAGAKPISQKFTEDFAAVSGPINIKVSIGEDLAYRAEHVSPRLRDRARGRSINDGFARRGHYGEKELTRLAKRLEKNMAQALSKRGMTIDPDAPAILSLVITDADPNRPTMSQLGKNASLSFRSFGIGGAEFSGTLTVAGRESGSVKYAWYETDIRDARHGSTWSDADRAIRRFASRTAKALTE